MNADTSLADELDTFYAHFKAAANSASGANSMNSAISIMHVESARVGNTLIILEHDVRKAFRSVNTSKAAGPDGISGWVCEFCTDQLAPVFRDIRSLLGTASNHHMLQTVCTDSIQTNNNLVCLNDLHSCHIQQEGNLKMFMDYNSVFYTKIPFKHTAKLKALGLGYLWS